MKPSSSSWDSTEPNFRSGERRTRRGSTPKPPTANPSDLLRDSISSPRATSMTAPRSTRLCAEVSSHPTTTSFGSSTPVTDCKVKLATAELPILSGDTSQASRRYVWPGCSGRQAERYQRRRRLRLRAGTGTRSSRGPGSRCAGTCGSPPHEMAGTSGPPSCTHAPGRGRARTG